MNIRGAHMRSTFTRSTPTWSTLTISTSHEINYCKINFHEINSYKINSTSVINSELCIWSWFHWTLQVLSNFSCPEKSHWQVLINFSCPKKCYWQALTKHCVSHKSKHGRFWVISFSAYKLAILGTMHTQLCIAAMAQFIETNRGGKNLHFEGYVYTKIRDGANSLWFWRCQNHKAFLSGISFGIVANLMKISYCFFFVVFAGIHDPHFALWPYISNGVLLIA